MARHASLLLLVLAGGGLLPAADGDVVFRSDVSLVRVDAQVLDRNNRAITGLRAEDFVLRDEGRPQQVRNFAREEMPVDVVLLMDVSASMRPHVQRIASAAHQALQVLGKDDRVAIMVFDRSTRLRLPFRSSREDVEREFEALLGQETFNGGTDITRGLLDAAEYVGRAGRREARRAIVILTDDQTERDRDEARVSRALVDADAVLSAVIAPDAMRGRSHSPGMGRVGGPLGGIILGRRGGYGGGRGRGTTMSGPRTHSAGTSEIARESGGDSMPVDDASALETTLARIRQRYALHFHAPEGVRPGEQRTLDVALAGAARRRYPDAEVRFRRTYVTPNVPAGPDPVVITPTSASRRKAAVSEPDGPRGANPSVGAPASQPASIQATGGWRRLKPGEQP